MDIAGVGNFCLNTINLVGLIMAHRENSKALKMQNVYAIAMVGIAVGVSVANTAYIVKEVRKS